MAKKRKSLRHSFFYIISSLLIVFGIYFAIQMYQLFNTPSNYYLIRNGVLTNYDEVEAYVIRNEKIIDTSEFEGERHNVILDSNKVSAGNVIAHYTTTANVEEQKEIDEIDNQIQDIILNSQINNSPEIKSIEDNIVQDIYKMVNNKEDLYQINELEKDINSNMQKKVMLISELPNIDTNLKELLQKRNEFEEKIETETKSLKAENPGIISYRIDGYEEFFDTDSFSNLSIERLKNIDVGINQLIPIDSKKVKIIDNFYAYLAVITNSKEAKKLNLNDTVKYSLDNDFSKYNKANVEYIVDNGNERLIILKTTQNIEYLTQYRKINLDLIWWNYEGLKVDNKAIYKNSLSVDDMHITEEIEEKYKDLFFVTSSGDKRISLDMVKIQTTMGNKKEVPVKIKEISNGFSIIENYSNEELLAFGISPEYVKNKINVEVYDEVIIN